MEDQMEHGCPEEALTDDEASEIRYSLTALGENAVAGRDRGRFYGFGPCASAVA